MSTQPGELGAQHGAAGITPYGDVNDEGSVLLMDALGQTGPTTAANHFARWAMVDLYVEAWEQASGRSYVEALIAAEQPEEAGR